MSAGAGGPAVVTPRIEHRHDDAVSAVLRVVEDAVAWLDGHNPVDDAEVTMRVLKVAEETGEAAQAWIGATGRNPRKGVTHSRAGVTVNLTTATRVSHHRGAAADSVWAFCPDVVRRVTVVGVWPTPAVHLIGDRSGLGRLRDVLTAALADLADPQGSTTARTVDSGPGAGPGTRSGRAGDRGHDDF